MEPNQRAILFIVYDADDYVYLKDVTTNAIKIFTDDTNCANSPKPMPALRLIGMNERMPGEAIAGTDPNKWSQATDDKYT